jgi:hypothetical protein
MSNKTWSTTFAVAKFTATMTYSESGGMNVEWEPDIPYFSLLAPSALEQYRNGRDAFLAEIGRDIGVKNIVILES